MRPLGQTGVVQGFVNHGNRRGLVRDAGELTADPGRSSADGRVGEILGTLRAGGGVPPADLDLTTVRIDWEVNTCGERLEGVSAEPAWR